MKLYIDTLRCSINKSVNGRVWEVETDNPVLVEDQTQKRLLCSQDEDDLGISNEPFLSQVPENFTI